MRNGIYFTVFIMLLQSCSLFTGPDLHEPAAAVESVQFNEPSLSLGIGQVGFVNLSINPSSVHKDVAVAYSYDDLIIAVDGDNFGAAVSALRAGSTALKVSAGGVSATCVVTVTGTNPVEIFSVITTSSPVIEVEEGMSKQVLVSLTGGTALNATQFSWSIDKNAVAGIESTGQNCVVTGKTNGTARITVTHPEATYPLELLVFVKPDAEKPVYITTSQNIVSLASGAAEKQISVSLVNGTPGSGYGFTWEVLNTEESDPAAVSLTGNQENALISPLASGSATIRITHPEALYPLDIKVRVVNIVENLYIEPSAIRVTLSGSGVQTVTARLSGSARAVSFDPGEFTWAIEPEEYCTMTVYQDGIALSGKRNGMAKVTVGHPAAAFSRELLVFVENQTSGAVNTAMYITTSQNFIRTKAGAADVELSVELVGGEAGDERDFVWTVTDPSILSMKTVHGAISGSRAVNLFQRIGGSAYITGLKEGVTTVSIAHPRIIGSTEVLVRVYPSTAVLELPLYIQGPAILGIVRGQTKTASLTITGNYTHSDDASLSWTSGDEGIVTVQGSGKEAIVTARGNGMAYIRVTHPKAEGPKQILCYVAETEAALAAYKLLYTEKTAYTIAAGTRETLRLVSRNTVPADTGAITWASGDRNVVSVTPGASNMEGVITGIANGTATVTASLPGIPPVEFTVTVIEVPGISLVRMPLYLGGPAIFGIVRGQTRSASLTVTGNYTPSDDAAISWSSGDSGIASVLGNGKEANITGAGNGQTYITAGHPRADGPKKILVYVAETEAALAAYKLLYTEKTAYNLVVDGKETLHLSSANIQSSEIAAVRWESGNTGVVSVIPGGSNMEGVVTAHAVGTATVTASLPGIPPVEFTVTVYPKGTDLTLLSSPMYFTAAHNVLDFYTLNTSKTVTVTPVQLTPSEYGRIIWSIDDAGIASVIPNGNTATVTALANGTARITVSHPDTDNTVYITVRVGEEYITADPPGTPSGVYFTAVQNVFDFSSLNTNKMVTVTPVNLPFSSYSTIAWSIDSTAIATVIPNGNTATVTAKANGIARITVSHPDTDNTIIITVRVGAEYISTETQTLYFTASHNVVDFSSLNTSKMVTVTPVNLPFSSYSNIAWSIDSTAVATVIPNGNTATITAKANGIARITVSHPDIPHTIIITVRAGAEYISKETQVLYFTAASNVVTFTALNSSQTISVIPVQMDPASYSRIVWQSDNTAVAAVIPNGNSATITSKADGTALIRVSHPDTLNTITITVRVNSQSFSPLPESKYFTTTQNVLQFPVVNSDKTVSVTAVRLDAASYSKITWTIDNPAVASVIPNGTSATVTAKAAGTAVITVSHPDAENILAITIRVGEEYVIVNPTDPFITASQDVLSLTEGGQGIRVSAELQNSAKTSGFSWEIAGSSTASVSSLGNSCFVVPKSAGQTLLTISHSDALYAKKVLVLVENSEKDLAALPYLTTSQNQVLLTTGTRQTVSVRLQNNQTETSGFSWQNNNPQALQVVETGPQALFNAASPGIARVTVTHPSCKYPLEITAVITDNPADAAAHPYITSAQNIVTVTKGASSKIATVTLAGGVTSDNQHFSWQVDNTKIISLTANGQNAVIRGLAAGECRITVSHPKAAYPFPLVVICEEDAPSSSLYISPSHPILTMKPADAEQTVSASLVGGTTEDKYGFSWYADNYNVIDLTSQANTAVISPKQEGTATITISHPKAAYDGKMTVRVTEYSTFAFSQTSMTTMEGTTQFISMQVPAMDGAYSGRITYTTDNAKIVTVTGTNKVAQITAVASGTAIVSAASPSGAKSDMMVYVQKATEATKPYITSTASVLSMKVGDGQRSVSASLVGQGVIQTDQYNLKWKVDNPGVASLIGTTGTSVLVKAVNAGETTVRISHEKTDSVFTLYIQVEGLTKGLLLNKNYAAIETGKTTELAATITGGTAEDYKQISWSAEKVNNQEIVTILGNGKTVAVYGVNPGQAKVKAEFNGNSDTCDVAVQASRQFSFDTQTMRIQPGQTKTFSYSLVPGDATINWMTTSNDYISYSVNTSAKTVSVTGVFDGNSDSGSVTRLSGTAQSLSASINITCAWDYRFSLGKSLIQGDPRVDPAQPDKFVIPYEVNPPNAKIEIQATKNIVSWTIDTANRKITLTPKGEGEATLMVTAVNGANGTKFSTQNCALNLAYSSLTLQPSLVSVNGRFSRYNGESGVITLGDGEDVTVKLGVKEINTNYTLSNVKITKTTGSSLTLPLTPKEEGMWNIKHPEDVKENVYTVYHDIIFYYNGNPITVNKWNLVTLKDEAGNETQYYVSKTNITETRTVSNFKKTESKQVWVSEGTSGHNVTQYTAVYENGSCTSNILLVAEGVNKITSAIVLTRIERDYTSTNIQASITREYTSFIGPVTWSREPIEPKPVPVTEFDANPKWRVPLVGGGSYLINDSAQYDVSPDTAVKSSKVEGYLEGSIVHNGTSQAFQIPIVVETRKCPSGSSN